MDPRYTNFDELNLFRLVSMSKVLVVVLLGGGSLAAY